MVLKVDSLKKSFGNNIIWDDLTAEFKSGEIVSIQGKSGEGKTTFLRCLNNLETVDYGSITIGGKNLCKTENDKVIYANSEELKLIRKDIGMVFQNFNLFPHMSLWENLMIAPRELKEDKKQSQNRANLLLKDLELEDKKDLYPYQLSGGQKQRAAIARACMLSPKVLCFDEPTSALDEETRGQIEEILKALAADGMAIIIVTHDRSFAEKISDKTLHIENGRFRVPEVY